MQVDELFDDGPITIAFFFASYLLLISDGCAVVGVSAVAVILGRLGTRFFSDSELSSAEAGRFHCWCNPCSGSQ